MFVSISSQSVSRHREVECKIFRKKKQFLDSEENYRFFKKKPTRRVPTKPVIDLLV